MIVGWWEVFGPVLEIFPQQVKEDWDVFQSCFYNLDQRNLPILLLFYSKLGLPEFISGSISTLRRTLYPNIQFSTEKNRSNGRLHIYNQAHKAHTHKITKWFQEHSHYGKNAEVGKNQFLQGKSQIVASFAVLCNKEDFINQLQSILLQLKRKQSNFQFI